MPAVSFEPLGNVFAECEIGEPLNGDLVVVVEVDKFSQFEMAGKRGRLRSYAFHEIAIGNDSVDVVVDDRKFLFVEPGSEVSAAHCHADAVRKTLAQRPGS